MIEFTGVQIPGVARVLEKSFSKNGKWSYTSWDVELQGDAYGVILDQDWETGKYLNSQTWGLAVSEFGGKLKVVDTLTTEQLTVAIRALFPNTALSIDKAEAEFQQGGDVVAELLKAQASAAAVSAEKAALLTQISQLEQAEKLAKETAESATRVAAVREALAKGGKLNLADLRAALA